MVSIRFLKFVPIFLFFLGFGCTSKLDELRNIVKLIESDDVARFEKKVNSGFDPTAILARTVHLREGTSIHVAAENQSEEIIQWLILKKFNFNCTDNTGETPLSRMVSSTTREHRNYDLFERVASVSDLSFEMIPEFTIFSVVLASGDPVHFDILLKYKYPNDKICTELRRSIEAGTWDEQNHETVAYIKEWLDRISVNQPWKERR